MSLFRRVQAMLSHLDPLVRNVGYVIVALIVGAAATLLVTHFMSDSGDDDGGNQPVPPSSTSTATPSQPTVHSVNPLKKLASTDDFSDVDSHHEVTVHVTDDSLQSSVSGSPTLHTNGMFDFHKPTDECVVTQSTDFCFAGYSRSADIQYNVYFFKDIVHTNVLREASDIDSVNIDNVASSAFMSVPVDGHRNARMLGVAFSDSSGFLIVLPGSSGAGVEKNIAQDLSAQ